MMLAAWQLSPATSKPADRYGRWAHMLGYGGHCLTKSRAYSVTFSQLRRARTEHRLVTRHPQGETDPWGRPVSERTVLIIKTWDYAGTEHLDSGDRQLALASAARALEHQPVRPAASPKRYTDST